MNSNMTLTVLNVHQQIDPKMQQDFKGQYSKVNQCHTMTWHTENPQPMSLPSINFLHLTVSEI